MKNVFTILFLVGLVSAAQAQEGPKMVPGNELSTLLVGARSDIFENYWAMKGLHSQAAVGDGAKFAAVPGGKDVYILNENLRDVDRRLKGHTGEVRALGCSPDGRWLASGSEDKTVRVWNLETGECVKILQGQSEVWSVCFSPNGRFVASGYENGSIGFWNVETGECVQTLKAEKPFLRVLALAFSPDGRYLASGSVDVSLWNLQTGACVRTFSGHRAPLLSVRYSADGRYLASASQDGTVCLWDIETAKLLQTLTEQEGSVFVVTPVPAGRYLPMGSCTNLNIWRVK